MDDVKYGEILGPKDLARSEQRVRRGFWSTLRKAAGALPFAEDVVAGYLCAIDRQTPGRVKAVLLGALAYFVLPLDTVPDILAGIGFADDATILLAAIAMVRNHITPAHREAAQRLLSDEGEEHRV